MAKLKPILIVILVLLISILIYPNYCKADITDITSGTLIDQVFGTSDDKTDAPDVIDPDQFDPSSPSDGEVGVVLDKANIIIGIIQVVGVAVALITIMVLGIKYMIGSTSEKAEYKSTMIPYLIGAILFFGITQVIAFVASISDSFQNV